MRVKYGDPVMARLVNVARPDWSSMWRPRLNGGLKNGPHRTRKRRRRREPTRGGDLVVHKKLKDQLVRHAFCVRIFTDANENAT
jgi:hypothetical protein